MVCAVVVLSFYFSLLPTLIFFYRIYLHWTAAPNELPLRYRLIFQKHKQEQGNQWIISYIEYNVERFKRSIFFSVQMPHPLFEYPVDIDKTIPSSSSESC